MCATDCVRVKKKKVPTDYPRPLCIAVASEPLK